MKDIEDFKKEANGDFIKYSVKDILGGLDKKLSRIEARLSSGDINFAEIQTTMKFYKRAMMGIYGLLGACLIAVIRAIIMNMINGGQI